MKLGKGSGDRALVEKLLAGPSLGYATTPVNVEKYIDFMVRVGTLRKKPDSWKDVFFDSAYKNNNN
jgi:NitT/TauT family transport system substrate-binding protein